MMQSKDYEEEVAKAQIKLRGKFILPPNPTPADRQAILRNMLAAGHSPAQCQDITGLSRSHIYRLCRAWEIAVKKEPKQRINRNPEIERLSLYTGKSYKAAERLHAALINMAQTSIYQRLPQMRTFLSISSWIAANNVMASVNATVVPYPTPMIFHPETKQALPITVIDLYLLLADPIRWREERYFPLMRATNG